MTTRPCKETVNQTHTRQTRVNSKGAGEEDDESQGPIHTVPRAAPANGLKRGFAAARAIERTNEPRSCVSYLRLREAEGGRELGPLRQGEVLRPLEPALQLLNLQRRVDRPRLPHLLPFAVDPCKFAILYRLFNVICNDRWARERSI